MDYLFEDSDHDDLQTTLDERAKSGWALHSIGRYSSGFWLVWEKAEVPPDDALPF